MIPDDAFTGPGDGLDRVPGDFRRNTLGQPLVKHPNGQRDLAYDRPSNWIADNYTGIDPIYSQRGTWVHTLTEHVDNGVAWSADLDFVAQGVGLGIPADVQHEIARAWERFKALNVIEIVHVECNVVNDALKVAGTLDRIVMHDGQYRVLDIKTGGKVDKTGYAVQLARYATSIPYDVDTDQRSEWGRRIDTKVGLIAHLPLNNILKGACGVEFQLVEVALHPSAINAAERLRELLDLNLSDSFHQVAAPTSSPSVVEPPGGGDATHGSETSPPPTLAEWVADVNANPVGATVTPDDAADAVRTHRDPTPTLDEQRARYKALSEGDKASVARYWERNDTDLTDPDAIAESIDAVTNFNDVHTEPTTRTTPTPAPTQPVNTTPDEGPAIPDADFTALSNIYKDYPKPARDWIAQLATQAQRAGLDFHTKGHRTSRRFHIMRALITLSEHPNRDNVVDRLLRDIHGDIIVDHNPIGISIGALDYRQARTVADKATEAAT